jgi:hypothetical protein
MLLGGFIWRNDLNIKGGVGGVLAGARSVVNFPAARDSTPPIFPSTGGFIKARRKALLKLIADATGHTVIDAADSPDEGEELSDTVAQDSRLIVEDGGENFEFEVALSCQESRPIRWERTVQMNAVPQFLGFSFTSHWRAAPAVQRHLGGDVDETQRFRA